MQRFGFVIILPRANRWRQNRKVYFSSAIHSCAKQQENCCTNAIFFREILKKHFSLFLTNYCLWYVIFILVNYTFCAFHKLYRLRIAM